MLGDRESEGRIEVLVCEPHSRHALDLVAANRLRLLVVGDQVAAVALHNHPARTDLVERHPDLLKCAEVALGGALADPHPLSQVVRREAMGPPGEEHEFVQHPAHAVLLLEGIERHGRLIMAPLVARDRQLSRYAPRMATWAASNWSATFSRRGHCVSVAAVKWVDWLSSRCFTSERPE